MVAFRLLLTVEVSFLTHQDDIVALRLEQDSFARRTDFFDDVVVDTSLLAPQGK